MLRVIILRKLISLLCNPTTWIAKQAKVCALGQHCVYCFGTCFPLTCLNVDVESKIKVNLIQLVPLKVELLKFPQLLLFLYVYLEAYSMGVYASNVPLSTCLASCSFSSCCTSCLFLLLFAGAAHGLHLPSASLRSANLCPRTAQACVCVVTLPCRVNR